MTKVDKTLALMLSPEGQEIVDYLTGDFLRAQMGKNDMMVASAMLTTVAIIVRAHCERTDDDFGEIANLSRMVFESALNAAEVSRV
jgi:hypothetical protein